MFLGLASTKNCIAILFNNITKILNLFLMVVSHRDSFKRFLFKGNRLRVDQTSVFFNLIVGQFIENTISYGFTYTILSLQLYFLQCKFAFEVAQLCLA